MTLTEKRKAFLEETISFYNSTNRGITIGGACRYYSEGTPGCAIGRHIADKELCKKLDKVLMGGTGVCCEGVFSQLPDDLKELGQDFLTRVQGLHDYAHNWTSMGLSETGQAAVNGIKTEYEL